MGDQSPASILPIESVRAPGTRVASRNATPSRRRTILKLLVFACSPIPLLAVSAVAGLALLLTMARLAGAVGPGSARFVSFGRDMAPYVLPVLTIVLPATILTAAYCVLARYWGVRRGWAVVSCVVLSVLAGLAICEVQWSALPGQNRLMLGLGFGTGHLWRLSQALPSLVLGTWLLRRGRDRQWSPTSQESARQAA